jgi:hypothetical protein
MMFSSNASRFALVVAAAYYNAVTSATPLVYPEPTVNLGTAGDYVILIKAGISTKASTINEDIGISPIAATGMTGFSSCC